MVMIDSDFSKIISIAWYGGAGTISGNNGDRLDI